MSAPHVSGLAALLKAANPNITKDQIRSILTSTADDLGSPGKDPQFGHGRINAYAAVQSAVNLPTGISPTEGQTHPCIEKARLGDYDCNGSVEIADFEAWREDYMADLATLVPYEWFREGFLGGSQPTPQPQ